MEVFHAFVGCLNRWHLWHSFDTRHTLVKGLVNEVMDLEGTSLPPPALLFRDFVVTAEPPVPVILILKLLWNPLTAVWAEAATFN